MRKKHSTEELIASALRQADSGTAVAEIVRNPEEILTDNGTQYVT